MSATTWLPAAIAVALSCAAVTACALLLAWDYRGERIAADAEREAAEAAHARLVDTQTRERVIHAAHLDRVLRQLDQVLIERDRAAFSAGLLARRVAAMQQRIDLVDDPAIQGQDVVLDDPVEQAAWTDLVKILKGDPLC